MNFDDPQRAPVPRALVNWATCGEPGKMGFIFFSGGHFWEVVVRPCYGKFRQATWPKK